MATGALATEVELKWVEVDLSPRADGKASVVYKVRYRVLSGDLHGFYLQGFDRAAPHFDYDQSYAFDSFGRRYGLSISPYEGDKWDVVLANGAAVSSGEVTYIILCGVDLAEMKSLFEEMADKVQAKAWDCDLEATKEYYRKQIQEQFERVKVGDLMESTYTSWGTGYPRYYYYYFSADEGRPAEIGKSVGEHGSLGTQTFAAFMHSDACHSACHSACVSGGAH